MHGARGWEEGLEEFGSCRNCISGHIVSMDIRNRMVSPASPKVTMSQDVVASFATMSLSGYCGEISRQSESHHIDEAGRFPSMFKGFGDHRVGQHHEDSAPGKHIDERLCNIGSMFEQNKTRH